jgi:hypothetical protein
MALVMAMIVVVLVTMLVAGAISFTGTELAASEVQTEEDAMSSCVQAARNLFLSKLRMEMKPVPGPPCAPEDPCLLPIQFDETLKDSVLTTTHLGQTVSFSGEKVKALEDPMAKVNDDTSVTGPPPQPLFYTVTAVCREREKNPLDPSKNLAEREVEFMVRIGL